MKLQRPTTMILTVFATILVSGALWLGFLGTRTALAQVPSNLCSDEQGMADYFDVPYPARNSAALTTLINCIQNNISNPSLIDTGQIYTYQQDVNLRMLNYTRGVRGCGLATQCLSGGCHEVYSCHYGGRVGHDGAEAVDFNAVNQQQESQLYQAIRTLVYPGGACYGQAKYIELEVDHIHLSTTTNAGCDSANIPGITDSSTTGGSGSVDSGGSSTPAEAAFLLNPIKCGNVTCFIVSVIKMFLATIGLFGTAMFIYGGGLFLLSGGNPEVVRRARSTIVYSTFGIIAVLISWIVVSTVITVTTTGTT